ncbi:MAG: DUF3228 family protein, partial [bacterium]
IELTEFALRHWKKDFAGTRITKLEPEKFINIINVYFNFPSYDIITIDGYADFCKLFVLSNSLFDLRTGSMPITLENYQYLRTGYSSRKSEELPVLSRWLDLPLPAPKAKYVVLVAYTREQLIKEAKVSAKHDFNEENFLNGAKYGIVAILAQMEPYEQPMKPMTMIRNALGIDQGGSGVPLDKEKYLKSIEFWSKNATVKS